MAGMTRKQIEAAIPHRPPFLWLDEVTEMTDSKIVAVKHLDPSLEVFAGHYPDFPVLPGVLQCEACFQAGAVLISQTQQTADDEIPVVSRQNNTQFRRMVRPGETLTLEAEIVERFGKAFLLKGKASVDAQVSVRLEFTVTTAPRPQA